MNTKKYKLINVTKVVRYKDKILLIDDDINEIEPYSDAVFEALKQLQKGCTIEDVSNFLKSEKDAEDLIEALISSELLKEFTENKYINTMLEKQWYYIESLSNSDTAELQERISTKTVAVIGVGGVGTVVIDHLVRAGVKKLVIVDFDTVNASNLNRQVLFTKQDIGEKKVDCVKKKVKMIAEDVSVQSISKKITTISDLDFLKACPIDILVNAADTPANIEKIIAEFGEKYSIPTISCSVGRHYGTWGPLYVPNETISYKCYTEYEEQQMTEYEKFVCNVQVEPLQASFAPTNTIVSVLMAKDVILFLALGIDSEKIPSINARCGINFMDLEFTQNIVDKNACKS